MVSVVISSVVDRGFEPRSSQVKDYTIGICYFSAKHAVLKRTSKDWLGPKKQDMSYRFISYTFQICGCTFQYPVLKYHV
jgi:hypothetical protein